MIGRHLDRPTLDRLLERRMAPEEVVAAGWHLRHCPRCREKVEQLSPEGAALLGRLFGPEAESPRSEGVASYGEAFARVRQTLAERAPAFAADVERAPELIADLLSLPPGERARQVLEEPRFRCRKLVELLLERSRQTWGDDPGEAAGLAELAQAVAGGLDTALFGTGPVRDLEARAWAYLANTHRIRSDLRTSERLMAVARTLADDGSGDPLVRAELLDLTASLRRDQRRFDEALELLRQTIRAYRRAGDLHLLGRTLLKQALVENDAGRPERGITLLEQARGLIEPAREPRLRSAVLGQLAYFLQQAGRYEEAEAQIPAARQAALEVGHRLDALRVSWVEGLLALDRGRPEEAEFLLREVRRGFVDEGIGYDAALVSLDLAALQLRHGRTAETRQLALEMLPIFQSRDIHREALAALAVFRRAVEIDTVTLGMVEDIAAYLRRSRHQSPLAFEQPS